MKDLYKEVQELNKLDPASNTERLAKLFEEAGELAQEINKTNGRKTHNQSKEDIIKEITYESADVIQNVFSIIDGYGISFEDLLSAMSNKNAKWRNKIDERNRNKKEIEIITEIKKYLLKNGEYEIVLVKK